MKTQKPTTAEPLAPATGSANGSGARARSGAGGGVEQGCRCIEETVAQIKDRLQEGGALSSTNWRPRNATELRYVGARHMALMLREGRCKLNIPFEATWILANGKTKEISIPVIASHCPFCGRPVGGETSDSEPSHSQSS